MKTIQHIAFNCSDLARQEAFYTKHFGFRRARVFNAGEPNEFILLRLGETCIELFSAEPAESTSTAAEAPVGFKHLAFAVPDIEVARAGLVEGGVEPGEIIDCSTIIPGMKVCFFRDPDGNTLELMQGYEDQF